MRKLIFFFIILLSCVSFIGQAADLRKVTKSQRKEYLINKAIEVTKNFGPEWYEQGPLTPKITGPFTKEEEEGDSPEEKKCVGRKYYRVKLYYDDATRKAIRWRFAAYVDIWADDGEPLGIIFGHNFGRHFLTIPYQEWIKAGVLKEEQIKFRKMVIPDIGLPKKELD